jgi:hypothetical protein
MQKSKEFGLVDALTEGIHSKIIRGHEGLKAWP